MRGRRKAEPQLVTDLLARLQSYNVQGVVVCKGCRRWTTEEEAQAGRWYSDGATDVASFYCPECLEREFGIPTSAAPVVW